MGTKGREQRFCDMRNERFVVDAARVATPTDKPRVERTVPYVRNNFFAGETFVDLADVRARAQRWCCI